MTMQDYIREVSIPFGAGVIETEISEHLQTFVESALRESKDYIKETRTISLPYQSVIDTTDLRIFRVKRILRGNAVGGVANPNREGFDVFTGALWLGQGSDIAGSQLARNFSRMTKRQQMMNAVGSDIDYKYIYSEKKLMPISNRPPSFITLMYVLDYENVEQVENPTYQDCIIRLARALAKLALGAIRTDFVQSNALWTDNGQMYLEQGKEEYREAIERLKELGKRITIKGA